MFYMIFTLSLGDNTRRFEIFFRLLQEILKNMLQMNQYGLSFTHVFYDKNKASYICFI